jgi:transcriptional regulator with XRE-family HTH domain
MTSASRGIDKSVHSPDQAAFCELLVGARKAAGLTQHALAVRLKKPQSFVAKYEGGERRIDVVEFVAIARALDADPIKLMAAFVRRKSKIGDNEAGSETSQVDAATR